jgi:CspA family cold shock protein
MAMKIRGVMKRFNGERGFGFIVPESRSGDVFVHIKALRDSGINEPPAEGTKLEFELQTTDRGSRAVNIAVLA